MIQLGLRKIRHKHAEGCARKGSATVFLSDKKSSSSSYGLAQVSEQIASMYINEGNLKTTYDRQAAQQQP